MIAADIKKFMWDVDTLQDVSSRGQKQLQAVRAGAQRSPRCSGWRKFLHVGLKIIQKGQLHICPFNIGDSSSSGELAGPTGVRLTTSFIRLQLKVVPLGRRSALHGARRAVS